MIKTARQKRGAENFKNGASAEFFAVLYLLLRGYWPLHRRYKSPVGEIDLIARRFGTLAFVEIKRRLKRDDAAFSIHEAQQRRIARAAEHFLQAHPRYAKLSPRFDCLCLAPGTMPLYIRNAFMAAMMLCLVHCSPVGMAVGAGAAVGTAATEERGLATIGRDLGINTDIQKAWIDADFDMYRRVNLAVREGRVLLTGCVVSAEQRLSAVRIAYQPEGVKEVINEIEICPEGLSVEDQTRDTKIAAELKSRMTFDKNIYAVNYSIDVVQGTVYIIGIARGEAEMARVLLLAKSIEYVRRVKNYVRVKK